MRIPQRSIGTEDKDHDGNEDEDGKQLRDELTQSVTRALSTRRPLLTHLNADTTWLLSLPRPSRTGAAAKDNRYFHILIDPWLRGSQSDVAEFFSRQWHAIESSVQTVAELGAVIRGIEDAARGGFQYRGEVDEDRDEDGEGRNGIDAVIISHEFTDHMHKPTLLEISPHVPVYATRKAAGLIRSWGRFERVFAIPQFAGGWRGGEQREDSLPGWLGITRLAYDGTDLLYYHSAIMISFSSSCTSPSSSAKEEGEGEGEGEEEAEAVIYTPHGVQLRDLQVLKRNPQIKPLALMHGLQDISLPAGAQLNLGAHNGLKVTRMLGARYWVGTHDEVKRGGGWVSWFLNRKVIALKDAIDQEREARRGDLDGTGLLEVLADVRFEELGNGESIVLE